MYNSNGVYQLGGQYYPWTQQGGNPYYNQYSQYFTRHELANKNSLLGQGNSSSSPSRKARSNYESSYKPNPALPPYSGPYPADQLQKARLSLIDSLLNDPNDVLQRVKPKIGIDSFYGPALEIIPPVLPQSSKKVASAAQGSSTEKSTSSSTVQVESLQKHSHLTVPSSTKAAYSDHSSTVPGKGFNLTSNTTSIQTAVATNDASLRKSLSAGSLKRKAVDDISDVKLKKSTSGTSIYPGNETSDTKVYKCDFCHFQCHSPNFVEHHLKEAKHFSASLYNSRNGQLVSVEKKLAVKNKQGKNEALVVVCPGCHDTFEDIFMCGVHYKYTHGGDSNNGYYAVCPLIHQETVVVYQSATCQVCKVVYEKVKHLHRHWDNEPSHHPLSKPLSSKAFALYSCLYCNKTFHTDFLSCKSHVLGHKDNYNQPRAKSALKVRHILLPTRSDELLPLSETLSQEGFKDELAMLKNMKIHFGGMSGTKSKIKMIEDRIRHLKSFRDAHLNHKTFTFK